MYDNAKKQALADIANGLQAKDFVHLSLRAQKDLALARQRNPPLAKKQLTKKIADERNAKKHAHEAGKPHPVLQKWIPAHLEEVTRSWLAAAEFSNAQIERVENLVKEQGLKTFDITTVRSVVRSLNLSAASGTHSSRCQAGPFEVEWATELAGLKNRVTTADEAKAEQAYSLVLAKTNSAPVFTNSPRDENCAHQTFSRTSVPLPTEAQAAAIAAAAAAARSATGQATENGASVSALNFEGSGNAALVLSSSAPAAVQFVGTRAPAPPSIRGTADAAVGVKRKLDARQESAPDDGLNPEEPGKIQTESQSRAPKLLHPLAADDCATGRNTCSSAPVLNLLGAHPTNPALVGASGAAMIGHMARGGHSYESLREAGYGVI